MAATVAAWVCYKSQLIIYIHITHTSHYAYAALPAEKIDKLRRTTRAFILITCITAKQTSSTTTTTTTKNSSSSRAKNNSNNNWHGAHFATCFAHFNGKWKCCVYDPYSHTCVLALPLYSCVCVSNWVCLRPLMLPIYNFININCF